MATFTCSTSSGSSSNHKEIRSVKYFVDHFLHNGAVGCTPFLSPPLAAAPAANDDGSGSNNQEEITSLRERSCLPLKTLKKLTKNGQFNVNEVEAETNISLLMMLCCAGREDAVKLLLKKGADPTQADINGWNSLFYAAWGQTVGCVKAILSSAGSFSLINTKNNWGVTPLMISVYRCELNVTQLLLKKGGDPFIIDNHQRTLIHWAAMGKQVPTLKYILGKYFPKHSEPLLDQEGTITRYSVDTDGASPLHYATIMSPCQDMLQVLLLEGFSPSTKDNSTPNNASSSYPALTDGLTPMHWACVMSNGTSINTILEHDEGMVHVLSRQQLTPLHLAACIGSTTLCKRLLENSAKVTNTDVAGMTPLHYACHYGHLDCVRLLLDEQADVNALSQHHMCGLHLASQEGHSNLVDYLVGVAGADKDLVSGSGHSAIHLAAVNGQSESIKSLLSQGCRVDVLRESDGRSSLHLSAYNGHLDCCHVLIENGAHVNRRDKTIEGCGPLDLAFIGNHTRCCDLLLSCDARTHGGIAHRAACTIQLSWWFYVHKRRKRITQDWAARVIQCSVREWQRREMARRVRKRRERKRLQAAIIIQRWWKQFLIEKRLLLESYNALRAKLKSERFATSLILKELSFNESNICLPPCAIHSPSTQFQSHSKQPQSHVKHPRSYTSSILRSSIEPFPQFPNESLVYVQQSAMMKSRTKTVRINTVPLATKPTSNNEGQRIESQTAPIVITREYTHQIHNESKSLRNSLVGLKEESDTDPSVGVVSIKGVAVPEKINRHACTGNERTDRFKLPAIGGVKTIVPSHDSVHVSVPLLPSTTNTDLSNNNDHAPHINDFSLPPIVPTSLVGSRLSSMKDERMSKKRTSSKEKHTKRGKETELKSNPSMMRPINETKLLLNTQRYQKLQHVAVLLKQAQDIQSIAHGEKASYDDLKNQIKTALDEAAKLRADTDTIWDTNDSS